MTQMSDSLARLSGAIDTMRADFQRQVQDLQTALEAERAEAARLAQAEAIEDVGQDQALSEARTETDRVVSELQSSADQVNAMAAEIESAQGGDQPAPPAEDTAGTGTGTDTPPPADTDVGGSELGGDVQPTEPVPSEPVQPTEENQG